MSWVIDKDRLQLEAQKIDSSVKLTTKDGKFWKFLSILLNIVTFSGIKEDDFLVNFATTIGPIQAYPKEWTTASVERILIHESRHTKQARWFGLGIHPWVGVLPMFLFYVLLFLPIGLAWFRYRLELDADKTYWRYLLEKGVSQIEIYSRAKSFAKTVSSGSYGWSVPQKWAVWGFKRSVAKVIKDFEKKK